MGNAYNWYRRSAHRSGRVSFGSARQLASGGSTTVHAVKVGGTWLVDEAEMDRVLTEDRCARAELLDIDQAYKNNRLLGRPGQRVGTAWGGYQSQATFHMSWVFGTDGMSQHWMCTTCWMSASLKHEKSQCHTCRDWSSCGQDCTLSAVTCVPCRTELLR